MNDLISQHERLIRHVAAPYASRGASLDDLMQEGRIALVVASRSWRADSGAALWTYAWRFVLGAMCSFVRRELRQAAPQGDEFEAVIDLEPTPEEACEARERAEIVVGRLARLTDDEHDVLRLHFIEDLTVREIGAVLGVSKTSAARRVSSALERARA